MLSVIDDKNYFKRLNWTFRSARIKWYTNHCWELIVDGEVWNRRRESSGKAVLLKILRSFRNCSAPTQRWEEVSEETVAQGLAHNQRPFKNLKATEHELEFGSVFFIYFQVDWFLRPLENSLRKRWISRSDGWRQLSRVKTNSSSWFLLVSFLFGLSDVQKIEQLSSFV